MAPIKKLLHVSAPRCHHQEVYQQQGFLGAETCSTWRSIWSVLCSCDHASWAKREERENTNEMQQFRCLLSTSGVYYQLLSQHVSGIIMPIIRRTKTVYYCIWCFALVVLHVVGCSCGALRCRVQALCACTLQRNAPQLQPTTCNTTSAKHHMQ